jgi:amino acid transporter
LPIPETSSTPEPAKTGSPRRLLGTFGGVFTPSILTILGIILFRRLGYVVGSAGLLRAMLMLGLATAISVNTSTSLSAIATNRKVRGGGDYYLISRSLGVEYGGALGVLLFLAQAVSVAFYCVGFGEGVAAMIGGADLVVRGAAVVAAVALFALAYAGSDLATRFQYVIMALLVAALTSFFVGAYAAFDPALLRASLTPDPDVVDVGFWPLFAIFFPAVTGFTQGVSMSGDLKDASRSLPTGTFLAVGISTVVYAAAIVLFAGARPLSDLAGDYESMGRVASVPWLIVAGVLSATLSSALASFLGAPRILQALASDQLFKGLGVFAVVDARTGNPRRAVVLTGLIAVVAIAVGDLNAIASVVSMFFLISYGLLNYATYVEATGASPSFRPRFRLYDARASLIGTFLCGAVMLAIDPMATALAVSLLFAGYQYLRWTAVPARWRDSRRAYRYRKVKVGLRELADQEESPVDWQPQILLFTDTLERRARVIQLASWISGGTGLITAVQLIEGDGASAAVRARRREAEAQLQTELVKDKLDAFPLVVAAPDLATASMTLLQAWGVGPISANTVALNWLERDSSRPEASSLRFGRLLQRVMRLGQNVVLFDAGETDWVRLEETKPERRRIDVWWFDDASSRLALLFAYLMTRTDDWDDAPIRVLTPVAADAERKVATNLSYRLEERRIEAAIEPVVDADVAAVTERSRDAAIVFLPFRIEGMRLVDPFGGPVEEMLKNLPLVTLVAAAQDILLRTEGDHEPDQPDASPPVDAPPDAD